MQLMLTDHFDASPEQVFAAMTSFDALPHWMNGLEHIEPLTEGGFQSGARFKETRKMYGKSATEEFLVGEVNAPKHWQLIVDGSKGSSGRGMYDFTYRLTPEAGGSKLVLDAKITGMGVLGELMGFLFMKRLFKKGIAKDHAALKAYLMKLTLNQD